MLFFFANLLKTLAAKLMATSFHTEAHFHKMQEALQKVCCLLAFPPRPGRAQGPERPPS